MRLKIIDVLWVIPVALVMTGKKAWWAVTDAIKPKHYRKGDLCKCSRGWLIKKSDGVLECDVCHKTYKEDGHASI